MVLRVLRSGILALLCITASKAQSLDSAILLQPTVIYGVPETAFRYGGERYTWDSLADPLHAAGGSSLASYLSRQAPVFMKSYGSSGMLSSIALRGTGASHTAVLWNGLNINSPTLGQTDFSQIPVALVDQLALQAGPGSAAYGTDALGGSVHLESGLPWQSPGQVSLRAGVGSFGERTTTGWASLRHGTFLWKLRMAHSQADNDFPYTDLTDIDRATVIQNNAAWSQTNVQPSLGWRLAPGHRITLHGWWQQSNRQIQPVMGRSSNDQQQDSSGRWVLEYAGGEDRHAWEVSAATSQDRITFNGSKSLSEVWQGKGRWSSRWTERWRTEAGLQANLSAAEGENYRNSATQHRLSALGSVQFAPKLGWKLGMRLRQTVWNGQWAPLTPSLSVAGRWPLGTFRVRAARSYRIPTLNDLYWLREIQEPIEPEDAWSVEGTLVWEQDWGGLEVTAYGMHVNQWILWVPGGVSWYPTNVREVRNLGLETAATAEGKFGDWAWKARAQYAYTRATILEDFVAASLGNQLPYTPFHQGSGWSQVGWQGATLRLIAQAAGLRYTSTDNVQSVAPYATLDATLGYRRQWKQHRYHLLGEVRNVTNEDYQVLRLRAMPGRSYHLTFQFDYHFKSSNTP